MTSLPITYVSSDSSDAPEHLGHVGCLEQVYSLKQFYHRYIQFLCCGHQEEVDVLHLGKYWGKISEQDVTSKECKIKRLNKLNN